MVKHEIQFSWSFEILKSKLYRIEQFRFFVVLLIICLVLGCFGFGVDATGQRAEKIWLDVD